MCITDSHKVLQGSFYIFPFHPFSFPLYSSSSQSLILPILFPSIYIQLQYRCVGYHCLGYQCLGYHCVGYHCLGYQCLGQSCKLSHQVQMDLAAKHTLVHFEVKIVINAFYCINFNIAVTACNKSSVLLRAMSDGFGPRLAHHQSSCLLQV